MQQPFFTYLTTLTYSMTRMTTLQHEIRYMEALNPPEEEQQIARDAPKTPQEQMG